MMVTSTGVVVKTISRFLFVTEVRRTMGAIDTSDTEHLTRVAKALSDPIRLRMLGLLAEGRSCCAFPDPASRNVPGPGTPAGICVCELQEQFGLGQSKTSYHLRVLKDAGLVTEETRGKWTFYELDDEAARQALDGLSQLVGSGPRGC
jgi:ArsR family transcriptional regulator, arsenate/arsenite/antimonite-responsive transcriptional repressor